MRPWRCALSGQVEADGVVGVVEGDGAVLPEGDAEGAVRFALFEDADVVGEGDGEVGELARADGEAGDGGGGPHDRSAGAGGDLGGVSCGLEGLAAGAREKPSAENGGVVACAEVHDEVDGLRCCARGCADGSGDEGGSAKDGEGDGVGAGRGAGEKGERARGVVDAEDVLAEDGEAEQEVDGESGGGAEVREVEGDGRGEGEMFRAEVEVVEDDGVHGFRRAAAGDHADGLADVEVEGAGEGVVEGEGAGAAVEDGLLGLAVEGDGDADEVVVEIKGDCGLLGGGGGAEQR